MNATNTFQDGLIMDSHPLATPNNVLTNCLNGTLITYNGNELILQNDVGNSKIETENGLCVQLKLGYIPVGLKEFGGILYIFSLNPADKRCEIGTFPSPNYNETKGKLINKYQPLHNYVNGNYETWDKTTFEDFNTKNLNFDVEHPLQIDCQKSYDDSINLIFTDNKNIPRLINTRFSLYGDNEYELVDRTGDNDTNIYFNDDFEYSTSLHKIVNSIVDIKFNGVQTGGNLPVGTYTFYFTLADSDDNESDFIGLSSVVTCYKGNINDPLSIDGGIENENSYKQVSFTLSKIPRQFNRVYVYYSRNSSDASGVALTTYHKLVKYIPVTNKVCNFAITGFELDIDIDKTSINRRYLTIDKAKTQSINLNILFYGNFEVKEVDYQKYRDYTLNNITYNFVNNIELGKLGLDFTINEHKTINGIDVTGGYYNVNNVYYYTGYWPGEFYRFGIVYIFDDYSLSNVYNIKGRIKDKNGQWVENDYGVIEFEGEYDLNNIKPLGIKFIVNDLPKGVIGYFFVRQKRLQTILAQGVRIGSDLNFSYLPLLYDNNTYNTSNIDTAGLLWTYYSGYGPMVENKEDVLINTETNEESDEESNEKIIILQQNNFKWEPAVIFTDLYRETYDRDLEDLFGEEAENFFRDKKDNWFFIGDIETVNVLGDSSEGYTKKLRKVYKEYVSGLKSGDDIKLGWFTEAFTFGEYKQYISENLLAFYILNLWLKDGYPIPKLGSSLIGTNQIGQFFKGLINHDGINENVNLPKINKYGELMYEDEPEADALIVPEYEVKQSYYNSIFTGGKLQYKKIGTYEGIQLLRRIFTTSDFKSNDSNYKNAYVIGVPENTSAVKTKNKVYSSVAGTAGEALRYKAAFTNYRIVSDTVGHKEIDGVDLKTDMHNLTWPTRGIWGPYVGFEDENYDSNTKPYEVVNITIPNRDALTPETILTSRKNDFSEYYPISLRIDIKAEDYIGETTCFNGDCFICDFAHTMNRNFSDPSFPTNDEITDYNTWAKGSGLNAPDRGVARHTDTNDSTKTIIYEKIDVSQNIEALELLNRADVNAVPLGHIFATKVYSSTNLCIRSTDGSNITERSIFGKPRSFYPLTSTKFITNNKISDSYVQNGAYEKSLGEQIYTLEEEVPANQINYSNSIAFSLISDENSFINRLRVFLQDSFENYTRLYGEITKLINYKDLYIVCVFEHAIALITVNEKAIATSSESGFSYIDTKNVISDTPTFIDAECGSLWPDSIINTTTGIYGIDTVAKKIWHYGLQFEVLSDLKIQKFLKDNLDVTEYDTIPNLTSLNVKTHYNKHKQDILFTFFKKTEDDYIGWNICYNAITKKFTTFYSWIPSYSGNINNIYYSFNNEDSISLPRINTISSEKALNLNINWFYDFTPDIFETTGSDSKEDVLESKTLTVNGVNFKMVKVKGGTFKQGIATHDITSTVTDYWISETLVTNKLFRAVLKNSDNSRIKNILSNHENDLYPVTGVALKYDVPVFLQELNRITGKEFKVPTLGQWTWAAKGGVKSKGYLYAGSNNLDEVAWHRLNSGLVIHPVKLKKPNELGLYDMSGLVWEWCRDGATFSYDYQDNGIDTEIPYDPHLDEGARFIKGGSIIDDNRNTYETNYTSGYQYGSSSLVTGFRIVCKNLDSDDSSNNSNDSSNVERKLKIPAKLIIYKINNGVREDVNYYTGELAKSTLISITGNTNSINNTAFKIKYKTTSESTTITETTGEYITEPQLNYLWQHNKENNWCNWYDEQHPFEFEFIVADHPEVHKIFNNLKMIANKTQPESFHYEVVGEAYDFKKDKPNMYYRLEETKRIYSNNYPDKDLSYDKNYTKKVDPKRNTKSAMFPLTVSHVDKKNKIYDTYQRLTSKSLDYQGMSGSEIVYDNSSNEFNIATHIKAYPIDGYEWTPFAYNGDSNILQLVNYYKSHNILVRYNSENECYEKKVEYGRRLGNCKYSEDLWDILIPSINYAEKNENWTDKPPINVAMTPIPEDLMKKGELQVPVNVETDYWGSLKQTRIRDKYIRIKVRYTGDNLAVISGIITQYKESYN